VAGVGVEAGGFVVAATVSAGVGPDIGVAGPLAGPGAGAEVVGACAAFVLVVDAFVVEAVGAILPFCPI